MELDIINIRLIMTDFCKDKLINKHRHIKKCNAPQLKKMFLSGLGLKIFNQSN